MGRGNTEVAFELTFDIEELSTFVSVTHVD
jgi:hypothetical protein